MEERAYCYPSSRERTRVSSLVLFSLLDGSLNLTHDSNRISSFVSVKEVMNYSSSVGDRSTASSNGRKKTLSVLERRNLATRRSIRASFSQPSALASSYLPFRLTSRRILGRTCRQGLSRCCERRRAEGKQTTKFSSSSFFPSPSSLDRRSRLTGIWKITKTAHETR